MKSVVFALALLAAQPAPFPGPDEILPPAPAWKGRSERLQVPATDPWVTPAEATGLAASPSYAQTRAFIDKLDAASPLIRQEVFGRSAQGRELIAVIATKDGETLDPRKPVLLAQAGIHSGEIDGKDAGLMLLRDIALRGKDGLLDRVNLVFVPIFNVDGHERASPYNRPNQRGPVSQGWRTTARNLNLNRDYAKADSPEMRAMIGLIRRYDPALYLDLHVTDGADYAYDITFGYAGWNGRYAETPAIPAWLEQRLRPALNKGLAAAGHIPGPLIFSEEDPLKGLYHGGETPRFSTGWGASARVPTVLVENHSLKPFRQRVLGTYVLLEESMKALGAHGAELRAAVAQDRALRRDQVRLSWVPAPEPIDTWTFHPIAHETYVSPVTGREEIRWLGRPAKAVKVPVYGQTPGISVARPTAYWVPATAPEVIERLRVQGIAMETLDAPRTVEVEMLRLPDAKIAAAASEGRVGASAATAAVERRRETFPAGSVRVPTDQPLGELAVLLLEPQSPDGFFAWGFFPEILHRTEYVESYFMAPLAERMLAADPELRAAFEAKLAEDPAFAADPQKRLAWFYARTPYYDDRYRLYPVGRER